MTTRLCVLDRSGDTRLTWDADDPAACAEARRTVADLKAQGYTFFLVDGTTLDEVGVGKGTLVVRRLDADEVVAAPADDPTPPPQPDTAPPPKRRGRPPKNAAPDRSVVAVRPMAGG